MSDELKKQMLALIDSTSVAHVLDALASALEDKSREAFTSYTLAPSEQKNDRAKRAFMLVRLATIVNDAFDIETNKRH